MTIYTKSERTERNYTIGKAVASARRRLGKGVPMCINAIRHRPLDYKITLEELNEISDEIVSDSRFYNEINYY